MSENGSALVSGQERAFEFENFELIPARRLLLREGSEVRIGSRAFDLLVALVQNAGQVISKEELLTRVWKNVIVEETNLRVHVCILRRLLEDHASQSRFIVHVARRGYIFVAQMRLTDRRVPHRGRRPAVQVRQDSQFV